jgi:hypothetical protein
MKEEPPDEDEVLAEYGYMTNKGVLKLDVFLKI